MKSFLYLVSDILGRTSLILLLFSLYGCFVLASGGNLVEPLLISFAVVTILGIVGFLIAHFKEISELNKSTWFFPGDTFVVRDTAISFFANRKLKSKWIWTVERYDYGSRRIDAVNENGTEYSFTHHEVSLIKRSENGIEFTRNHNKELQ